MSVYPVLKGGKEFTAKSDVSPSQSGTTPEASDCLQLQPPRERVPGCQPHLHSSSPSLGELECDPERLDHKAPSLLFLTLRSQPELKHESVPDLSPKQGREKGCRKITLLPALEFHGAQHQ